MLEKKWKRKPCAQVQIKQLGEHPFQSNSNKWGQEVAGSTWKKSRKWYNAAKNRQCKKKKKKNKLGGIDFDTHRLGRNFHSELRPWGSDEIQNTAQLINVYHTDMKENRKGWRVLDDGEGGEKHNSLCCHLSKGDTKSTRLLQRKHVFCYFVTHKETDSGWKNKLQTTCNQCLVYCKTFWWLSIASKYLGFIQWDKNSAKQNAKKKKNRCKQI